MVTAGCKLEVEGKVKQIVDRVKAAAADAAKHVKAAGERLSEKRMGQPKQY
jgi:hypothetical protein